MEDRNDPREIGSSLVDGLLDLLEIPSVSGQEGPAADHLEARYLGERCIRLGNSLVVGDPDARPLVLLVGHIDVVARTDDDRVPHLATAGECEVVVGPGASDMKSGVAVAQALFDDPMLRESSAYALVLVLYAGEEGPIQMNELEMVLEGVPWLREASLAIVLEPSDLEVQLGCLGRMHAQLTFRGEAAHSGRPWLGNNALTQAGSFLAELHALEPLDVEIDGVVFREVSVATQANTFNPANVVPDRLVVNLNHRFAPTRTVAEAEARVRALVARRAEIEIVNSAPGARPHGNDPIVRGLIARLNAPTSAKQGWTDVARLARVGVPAVNFGPGLTAQAHRAGEFVPIKNLIQAYMGLRRFLLEM